MKNKGGTSAVYDEDARRDFILGFHNRKQAKKVEYLTKKALREKKERALEKIAKRRNLLRREKEYGLLDSVFDKKVTQMNSENIKDKFSKDMFGTDEVTVTVEYEGDKEENEENEIETNEVEEKELDDEELLNEDENANNDEEEELNEEEEKLIESITLSERELRKIREQAANKKKKGKKKRKHTKRSRH